MALEPFVTHTGLTLMPPFKDEDGLYVFVIKGDRDKEICRTSFPMAMAAFRREEAHYKQRAKDEA